MSNNSSKNGYPPFFATLPVIFGLSAVAIVLLLLPDDIGPTYYIRSIFAAGSLILSSIGLAVGYVYFQRTGKKNWSNIFTPLSAYKITEQALSESEARYKLLVEKAPIGIITFEKDGRIIDVNSKLLEIIGSPSAEKTREINVLNFAPMVKAGLSADFINCFTHGETRQYEKAYLTKWGKNLILRYNLTPLRSANGSIIGVLATMEDFTDRKAAEEELRSLHIQAKESAETQTVLLEEVNHRVKNNLAGIIGMLYATRKFINKEDSHQKYFITIENLISRIEGIAAIHEILTEANWSSLPISELTNRIFHSSLQALPMDKHITAEVIAEDDIMITPKYANNLGMVINELVTNTIKHAVAERQSAVVTVHIRVENGEVLFKYRNDGPGFPDDILSMESIHTGMYLIDTIVTNGLGGTLHLENDNGAVTLIRFKP